MAFEHSPTVIVVGAGPVGLFLALRLAQLSVPVLVLEAVDQLTHSPKAYAYQAFIFPEFEKAGVLADFLRDSAKENDDEGLTWRTPGNKANSIFYRAEPPPGKSLSALKLSQYEVCQKLLRHIAKYDHARVLMGHRVTQIEQGATTVKVTTQVSPENGARSNNLPAVAAAEKTFTAQYLVGADGGRSVIRKLSDIAFQGETLPQHLVAAEVRYPFEKHGAAGVNFIIDPEYYGVWGPIDNHGLWRVSFGLPQRSEEESWTEEEIRKAIPSHFDNMFPGPRPLQYEIVNIAGYRTHQLHAETFRKGRVMLVGDAAHCKSFNLSDARAIFPCERSTNLLTPRPVTNPFMAFGLVSGIYDASSCASALAAVIHGTATDTILDSWAIARQNVFTRIVDPSSRAAFKAIRMDARNDPASVIKAHPVIQRFEGIKNSGGKFTPPPLGTDITTLDGWIGPREQQEQQVDDHANGIGGNVSGLGMFCQRIVGGFQNFLTRPLGLASG